MINHSGIGTNIRNMIPGLASAYKLTLLGSPNIINSFSWSGAIDIIETISQIYSFKEQLELPAKIPECDIFLSPHYNIPIKKIRAGKRVVVINDVNHLVFSNQLPIHKRMYAQYMLNAAVQKSDKIFTLSEFSKSEMYKYLKVGDKDITVLYCGLDREEIKKKLTFKTFEEIRTKYTLPESYFLYVGSTKPHKNLLTAIQAFNYWKQQYNGNQKLVLVGVKKEELSRQMEIQNSVDFNSTVIPGYIANDDLPIIYNNAKCLIFPSLYEGFGLPPLEAMISGCPVLSSNSASLPEVCGDAALYFEPFNSIELAQRMVEISNNDFLKNALINKGYKNILRFTREKMNEKLVAEINSVLKI
ncbi:MAG: glycosyltransferase family 4 protein [Ignavibacteriaceae bacterium]|nr:glycosyltransferase family 4 protein [Ignavibacteriaceae bacterium]